jgi:bleomycin hydrolase
MSQPSRKRSAPKKFITEDFIRACKKDFRSNPANTMARNAVVSVGALLAATDSEESKEVTHIFVNSIKKRDLKATDQGSSGRCWMFAALNSFRHYVVNGLGIDNFEFSETYLFFWDKFERSNTFLQNMIELDDLPGSRIIDLLFDDCLSDGGYWNYFVNLVDKYGLVPKDAMPETYQSDWSDDMNNAIVNRLKAYAIQIHKEKSAGKPLQRLTQIKNTAMKQVFSILVKFLGEPPKKFTWFFNDEDDSKAVADLTPMRFKEMCIPNVELSDFVVVANVPCKDYDAKYRVKFINNVQGGAPCDLINMPIEELQAAVQKSVVKGAPVWFAGDVSKGFHPYKAAFNNKLMDDRLLFGDYPITSKAEKFRYHNLEGNHAMCFTGVNCDRYGKIETLQVENSWGYWDNETPGLDGFLCMSKEWFDNNVVQVVIHKSFLSRRIEAVVGTEPELLEPWDYMAPAVKVRGAARPKHYLHRE